MSIRRLVQLLFAVLALGLVSSAGATPPGTNGRIVYSSERSGNTELYSVAPDGSADRRLTWTSATEQEATWSPDGTKLAYERAGSGERWRIWVMNADGSSQTQLPIPSGLGSEDDIQPQWSPDGTQIAFASTRTDTWNVWVVNADGTGLRRVTNFLSNNPAWSPDGRQIAYVGLNAIGIVDADGSNPHSITGVGGWAGAPSWSPDGRRLVYYRNNDRGYPGELYVANPDGSNEAQLTTGGFNNASASWSPDGTEVVFQRSQDAATQPWHLWKVGADGSNLTQLRTTQDLGPDWGTSQVVPEPSPPDAPTIEIYSPTDGGMYFPGARANAFYSCSSFVSYVVTCEGDLPLGQEVDLSTAGEHRFTVRAVDVDGRTATKTVTYEVLDVEPPQIDLRTPSDGATYDLGADVTVDYSCSDPGGSGVAQCTGDLPNGSRLNTDSAGTRTFHVFALDNANRLREVTATYTIVDRQPPRVVIQSPLEGHDYSLGAAWSTNYYCWSPGNVRIVSCNGPGPSGGPLDTTSLGPHSFAVTATDANGKTTTASVPYRVIYLFKGFDPPVDTGGNLDGVRAGDSVALKFSLDGDHGLDVVTKTTWQPATCGDWIPTGPANPADGRLSYSASTDRYREIVPSSSSWRGSCRLLRFDLNDGTHPEVRVRFKK